MLKFSSINISFSCRRAAASMRSNLPQHTQTLPPKPAVDQDAKLWAGQLYLSHTSEIVAKLLYKKFYRNTDCTILYGKWSRILREQHKKMHLENMGTDSCSPELRAIRYDVFVCVSVCVVFLFVFSSKRDTKCVIVLGIITRKDTQGAFHQMIHWKK